MNYRLKRIQKGKPLKKTEDTDAIFDNVQSTRSIAGKDPNTLEISIDTKTKVKLGEYSQGEKTRTDSDGNVVQTWDHDPPGAQKLMPFGVLEITISQQIQSHRAMLVATTAQVEWRLIDKCTNRSVLCATNELARQAPPSPQYRRVLR